MKRFLFSIIDILNQPKTGKFNAIIKSIEYATKQKNVNFWCRRIERCI